MAALREVAAVFGIKVDDKEVKQAEKSVSSFTDKLKTFATIAGAVFVARGIVRMIDGVRLVGDELDKTSQQLGLSIESLQSWRFAAGLAGVDGTAFSQSLGILQKNAFEANRGTAAMAEAFQKLGVSVRDSNGQLKDGDTLLQDVGVGLFNLENESEKVALALTLMGRTGRKLLPLFSQGAKGIAIAREEFEALGGGLSAETIDASVELTDEMLRFDTALQSIKSRIALAVLPALSRFFQSITRAAAAMAKFLEGTHLVELGMVALGIAATVASRTMIVAAVKALIGWAPMIGLFLLISLVVGLVILAVDDLIVLFEGGESVAGDFIDLLLGIGAAERVVEAVKFAWDDLIDSIAKAVDQVGFFKDVINTVADFIGIEAQPFEGRFAPGVKVTRSRGRPGTRATQAITDAETGAGAEAIRQAREQRLQNRRRRGGRARPRTVQTVAAPLQAVQVPAGATSNQNNVNQQTTNTVNIDARGSSTPELVGIIKRTLRQLKDDDNTAALEALVPQGTG